jgi:hypothetical protein
MSVLVEFHNTGDAVLRMKIQVAVEHVLSGRLTTSRTVLTTLHALSSRN